MMALSARPMDLAETAKEHVQQFGDPSSNAQHFYIVADQTTATVLAWVLSSCSLQQEIELCVPVQIQGKPIWLIDIAALGWRTEDWQEVLKAHPYGGYSRVVRGDWLALELLDTSLSATRHEDGIASYYRLLYRGSPPKTEEEFLKFWEIDNDKSRHRGQIEGISQVNRRGRRLVERRNRIDGYFYVTRDSFALRVGSDALEDPSGGFRHDGSEAIVGFSKFSSKSLERGSVQFYALFDGAGVIVNEAPVALVEDFTRARGIASIRTFISCVQCHVPGIHPLDENALVQLNEKHGVLTLATSADPVASQQVLQDIRRFHFGSLDRDIKRAQEDYAAGVRLHTAGTAEELVAQIQSVVETYDAEITLERAAIELGTTAEVLSERIIEYAGVVEGKEGLVFSAPAGLLILAKGGTCSRDLFEQQYLLLNSLVTKQ